MRLGACDAAAAAVLCKAVCGLIKCARFLACLIWGRQLHPVALGGAAATSLCKCACACACVCIYGMCMCQCVSVFVHMRCLHFLTCLLGAGTNYWVPGARLLRPLSFLDLVGQGKVLKGTDRSSLSKRCGLIMS